GFAPGKISVLLGNGDGTFKSAVTFSLSSSPFQLVAADLNGDGNLDLVVAESEIGVLLGNGNGTFQLEKTFDAGPGIAVALDVADLNQDGKLDVVAAEQLNFTKNFAGVLLGNGDGTLQPGTGYPVSSAPTSIVAADFDQNGTIDVAVSTFEVEVLK